MPQSSPPITRREWGEIEVGGQQTYRDAKLWPGGSREWNWNEAGTEHVPGIQPADVREILQYGPEVIILSQGVHKRLKVPPQTREWLERKNVEFEVLSTPKAVDRYNELASDIPVGALIHTTC